MVKAGVAAAPLAVAAALLLIGCGSTPGDPVDDSVPDDSALETALDYTVLDETSNSGRTAAGSDPVVLLNMKDYQDLWAEHVSTQVPAPPAPAVDFASSTVVGIFDDTVGPVAVTDVTRTDRQVTLHIEKTDTSQCPRVQVIEHNAVIVDVDLPPDNATSFTVDRTVKAAHCP